METAVLKALAEERRLRMVELLLRKERCVRALARELGISESAASQHLKVLREAGLLTGVKRGYFTHYEVDREVLRRLAGELAALAELEREHPCRGGRGCGCRENHGGRCVSGGAPCRGEQEGRRDD